MILSRSYNKSSFCQITKIALSNLLKFIIKVQQSHSFYISLTNKPGPSANKHLILNIMCSVLPVAEEWFGAIPEPDGCC